MPYEIQLSFDLILVLNQEEVIEKIKVSIRNGEKIIIYTPYSKDIEPIESLINSYFKEIKSISIKNSISITRNQLIKFYLDINKNNIIIGNHTTSLLIFSDIPPFELLYQEVGRFKGFDL